MNPLNIKGYALSTDYEKLFDLIQEGYRIPCWIAPEKKYPDIWIIAECKLSKTGNKEWEIGYRGGGFLYINKNKQGFAELCEILNLHYIPPNL